MRCNKPIFFVFFLLLQVLTKDSVTVSVDAVVYYRVSNATVSVANVENAHHSTRLLAQTTLRNILGTKNLHEILSDRESISGSMQVCNVLTIFIFNILVSFVAYSNVYVKNTILEIHDIMKMKTHMTY